ncbi:MAG: hypothetical protein MZU84_05010 [Sphingobacterium sp.]|nr:hypothetical protein [Sphingobacterium sp.]
MGESGDIIFPKLSEERDMIAFDAIATDLLKYIGMDADICTSEDEAKVKAGKMGDKPDKWPVYFFESDTSGEKPYEEFFTEKEIVDNDKFTNLGIIKNSVKRDQHEIDEIFKRMLALFASDKVTKVRNC